MSAEQPGNVNPQPFQEPEKKEAYDDRDERRERRREGRHGSGGWVVGAVLILVGLYLVLQNAGLTFFNNWWALFILIPAIGALATAWREYNQAGQRLVRAARGSLIVGLILLAVTAIFIFNLNWGVVGPVLLILAGLGIVLNVALPS